jgi:hypothetical protein
MSPLMPLTWMRFLSSHVSTTENVSAMFPPIRPSPRRFELAHGLRSAGRFGGSRNLRFSGVEYVPAAWLHRSSRTTAPGQPLQNLADHCYDV